jgi:hypothetical protein
MMHRVLRSMALAAAIIGSQAVCALGSEGSVHEDMQGKKWYPLTGHGHQIFPSTILSMARSAHPLGFLAVKLFNVKAGDKVRVEVRGDAFIEPSVTETTIKKDASEYLFPQAVRWKMEVLQGIHQETPARFTTKVSINGEDWGEKTDTATMHSVNDCLFAMRGAAGEWMPLFGNFGAYVNEESPKLDGLLKDALAAGVVEHFDGYQSGNPRQVVRQVMAIWEALRQRGIRYSSTTDISVKSPEVWAQHVRFASESIENGQANCVDGSVAIASALQKIGIDTGLVMTQDHMFILIFTQPGEQGPVALETTLMGAEDYPKLTGQALAWAEKCVGKDAAGGNFAAALCVGTAQLVKMNEVMKEQASQAHPRFVAAIMKVSDMRKHDILPVPEAPAK